MTDEKFTRVRSAFRHQMAELSTKEIRDGVRFLRFIRLLNTTQLMGLLEDMNLMLDYKAKKLTAREEIDSLNKSWVKS